MSSLPVKVKQFAHAFRSHCGIENSCHWCLDVTYREDESRIRNEYLRANFAWLNRLTLSLLKQHPDKDGVAVKRRGCSWNKDSFRGVFVALVTPMTADEEIDLPKLAELADHLIRHGLHGLVPLGSTGEYYALSGDERERVCCAPRCKQPRDGCPWCRARTPDQPAT